MKLEGGEVEAAIKAIEEASATEVVVAVRSRARAWLLQHAVVGCIAAVGVLAFALRRGWPAWEILVLPVASGVMGALLVEAIPPLYRFLAPAHARREHVREAARAVFVERGIHATRDRTGLLVYVAVRERIVELVGDLGVVEHVGRDVIPQWADRLTAALPNGLGKALADLAPDLARALPRRADDANELGDAIVDVTRGPASPS